MKLKTVLEDGDRLNQIGFWIKSVSMITYRSTLQLEAGDQVIKPANVSNRRDTCRSI
jgi:hypothetical protein